MDLVEKVARVLANIEEQIYPENDHWVFFTEDAEAAIAIVIEEAAKQAGITIATNNNQKTLMRNVQTAIRALKE